uniref:Uncharacterized protein n=1 Tax=Cacopsylla melanoneura TaxID=428564 RepID=A0A8D8Q1Y2_9HEMI
MSQLLLFFFIVVVVLVFDQHDKLHSTLKAHHYSLVNQIHCSFPYLDLKMPEFVQEEGLGLQMKPYPLEFVQEECLGLQMKTYPLDFVQEECLCLQPLEFVQEEGLCIQTT